MRVDYDDIPKNKLETMLVKVHPGIRKQIRVLAARQGISRSSLVHRLLQDGLSRPAARKPDPATTTS